MTNNKMMRKQFKVKLLWVALFYLPCLYLGEHLLNSYLFTHNLPALNQDVVLAQSVRPDDAATQVYQTIPELGLENEYIGVETGEQAVNNTLISRLIRYHLYVKSRPSIYRLDWKLTLADYLGKNEVILERRYPGNSTLTENPLENDRQIIKSLTRNQRDKLVNTLVSIYNPNFQSSEQTTTTNNSDQQSEEDSPNTVELPLPGGADLLLP